MSIPHIEALALPIEVEQTTSEPTPIWLYISRMRPVYTNNFAPVWVQLSLIRKLAGRDINTPGTSTVASSKTSIFRILFLESSCLNLLDSMCLEAVRL